jgi:hypothetical protein
VPSTLHSEFSFFCYVNIEFFSKNDNFLDPCRSQRSSSETKVPEGNSVSLNVIYNFCLYNFFSFSSTFSNKFHLHVVHTYKNFRNFENKIYRDKKKVLELRETCRSVKNFFRPYVEILQKISCAPFGFV